MEHKIFPVIFYTFSNLPTIYSKQDETMNEQTKRKIAYALRGRKKSATTKKLISQALRNQQKTKQHKQAISEAMKQYWLKKNNLYK